MLAGLVVLVVPTTASAVQASQSTVVNAVPASYTPDVNNGTVYAIAQSGSTVVLGGSFTSVSPHGSSTTYDDSDLTAFTAGTGARVSNFQPTLDGTVNTVIAGPTSGTVYVGGSFTTLDGVTTKLALISTATGAIVPGWTAPSFDGPINSLALSNGQLYVGGDFNLASGVQRLGMAVLNPTSGAQLAVTVPTFQGHHNYGVSCDPSTSKCADAGVGVKSLDINPAGTQMVAIGNFTSASSQPRDQVAVFDLSSSGATLDTSWATEAYTAPCTAGGYDSYVRDVQYSPNGSYFVIAATGGGGPKAKNSDGTHASCDAATRFEASSTGSNVRPTWVDYTGDDTFLSVAITGTAVYLGGHERWVNNTNGSNSAQEGAVPRPGIVALDPINGLPLAWNPGRNPRGAGAYSLLATSDGLYVGSDTDYIGNRRYLHKEIAFFPLAGGETLAPDTVGALPGDVYLLGGGTSTARAVRWDGSSTPELAGTSSAVDWSATRGAFEIDNEVYYASTDGHFYRRSFDGSMFGPAVAIDPYDDPAWDDVQTGSNQTYRGVPSSFYGEMTSITSMFYSAGRVYYTLSGKSQMFWRWFEPDSGVVGADEFTTTDGMDWSHVAGAFLSDSTLYFADSATGSLSEVPFVNGQASGTPTVANTTIDWKSAGAFVDSNATATTLAVSPDGSVSQGHNLTLTATVSPVSGSTQPQGSVTFKDGATTLGTEPVMAGSTFPQGTASLTTPNAPPSAPGGAKLTAYFTAQAGSGLESSFSSPPVAYTINPVASVPTRSGDARVGAKNTCSEASSAGETVRYTWMVRGSTVATGKTYSPSATTRGKSLECTAKVSMANGPASSATSKSATVALGAAPSPVRHPRLSGRHRVGAKESVSRGTWSPKVSSYSFQWYRGTKRIRHADASKITLTRSDREKRISCRVTTHKTGYASRTVTTNRIKVGEAPASRHR